MLLRPRQQKAVSHCVDALNQRGNTMLVAPTGAGKTLMLSAVIRDIVGTTGRGLVLQHRGELLTQNRAKFKKVTNNISTGVVDADEKQFGRQVLFAMTDTLRNDKNLERLPPQDIITIDEGHRGVTPSNLKIIEAARRLNPDVKLFLVTATPERGDQKSLREVVDNIADQISIGELIAAGHLVRPRTFVIDLGVQNELRAVKKTPSDFDMKAVEKILDKSPLTARVIDEWKKLAGDRITVFFTSTVDHAVHVTKELIQAGVKAECVTGETPDAERSAIFARLDKGTTQVLVNVAVATEGWDCPPVACVVLLRPSSHKSTMIQMIGRGLRTVDPELYPGVVKQDCIVLDFGTSVLMHGSLEQEATLGDGFGKEKGEGPKKECPQCQATLPAGVMECGLCGFVFMRGEEGEDVEKATLDGFVMTEIDIFSASPFRWEEIFDGAVLVATAFDAWAMCVLFNGAWHALGGAKETGIKVLAIGERLVAIAAADDYLREFGDTDGAKKSKRWLTLPATDKQLGHLGLTPMNAMGLTRYKAACFLTWKYNERGIKVKLMASERRAA